MFLQVIPRPFSVSILSETINSRRGTFCGIRRNDLACNLDTQMAFQEISSLQSNRCPEEAPRIPFALLREVSQKIKKKKACALLPGESRSLPRAVLSEHKVTK